MHYFFTREVESILSAYMPSTKGIEFDHDAFHNFQKKVRFEKWLWWVLVVLHRGKEKQALLSSKIYDKA